ARGPGQRGRGLDPAAGAAPGVKMKKTSDIPQALAPVAAAFAKDKAVTVGKMMASVGLKVNEKIFAMLVRGDLVVKLPRARVDELVAARTGKRFDPRRDGRVMKEWLVVGE